MLVVCLVIVRKRKSDSCKLINTTGTANKTINNLNDNIVISLTFKCLLLIFNYSVFQLAEQETSADSINMKRCGAYEITTLSQQKVVMKKNEAYETVLPQSQI